MPAFPTGGESHRTPPSSGRPAASRSKSSPYPPPTRKPHLTRRYRFSSSHRLDSAEMSAEENLSTYGKCNNPYGHGHNYTLEVTVSGQVDPATGMVCNLVELDTFVSREVVSRYDLENLNTLQEFAQTVPTTEN